MRQSWGRHVEELGGVLQGRTQHTAMTRPQNSHPAPSDMVKPDIPTLRTYRHFYFALTHNFGAT